MILKEYKYRYKNNPKPRCAASSALPADAELALKGAAGLGVDLVELLQISDSNIRSDLVQLLQISDQIWWRSWKYQIQISDQIWCSS